MSRHIATLPTDARSLAVRSLALCALALVGAAPAAAQLGDIPMRTGALYGAAVAANNTQQTVDRHHPVTDQATLSAIASVNGASAVINGNMLTGRMGAAATAALRGTSASAELRTRTSLTFERAELGYLQPIEFYFDGSFHSAWDWMGDASARSFMEVTEYGSSTVLGRAGGYSDNIMAELVPSSTRSSETLWIEVPRSSMPGSTFTITFVWALAVAATDGHAADFSHTAAIYVPKLAGQRWVGHEGFLSQQQRPVWATNSVPGELENWDAPVTTTPEPATLALVAGGLCGIALTARRRR
jgi:hypothetical protein